MRFTINAVAFLVSLCFYGKATAENDLLQISNLLSQYKSNSDDVDTFNFRRRLVNPDGPILGSPSKMSHLPKAEPILPAHTLIKPALGMLKSAIKFPHKDYADESGVYGNINNLGLAYAGKNERLMYSGFRRMPSDYILVAAPHRHPYSKDSRNDHDFSVSSIVLDSHDKADKVQKRIAKHLEKVRRKKKNSNLLSLLKTNDESGVSDKQRKSSVYLKEVLSFDLEKPVNSRRVRENKYSLLHHIITDINKLRREADGLNDNFPMNDEEDDIFFPKKQKLEYSDTKSEEKNVKTRLQKFYETQDVFDHVKLDQNAPDMKQLLTNAKFKGDDQKKWWFYSQDDFTSLTQTANEKNGAESETENL